MSAHLVNPVGPDDHVRGAADAKLTVVEYGDYQCPYCGQAYSIVEKLAQTFASSMRLVFRNLPLADVHPHAERAAEFAEAAGLQDKFWPMHDKLYENQRSLDEEALRSYATEVGVDLTQLDKDLEGGAPRARVEADLEGAIRSGANGTPNFFVNGLRYDGSWFYDEFAQFLQSTVDTL
jgi:protein-disulfide isomerase